MYSRFKKSKYYLSTVIVFSFQFNIAYHGEDNQIDNLLNLISLVVACLEHVHAIMVDICELSSTK